MLIKLDQYIYINPVHVIAIRSVGNIYNDDRMTHILLGNGSDIQTSLPINSVLKILGL